MRLTITIVSAAALCASALLATANQADRRAAMKQVAGAAKAISGGTDVSANAQLIVDLAGQIPVLFEANEVTGNSKALPAIWENYPDFIVKAADLAAAAQAVADAQAAGGDVATAAKAMGASCGACHKSYKGN